MKPGEHDDFEAFVHAAWPRMFKMAHALTGNRSDAEDLLQSAFVRVCSSWRRVSHAERPDAYVRRIIANEAASTWRRRWRHVERSTDAVPERASPSHDDSVLASDIMWRCLQRLPARQRAVVVLRYYEDLSEREIADTLGISPGTVKSRASAALKTLRNEMELREQRTIARLQGAPLEGRRA